MEALPGITALLGPTNTGKTHRAVERMLDGSTGMIGLPLRLLARELYDRVTTRVGEQRVALVTGEEKRIPKSPSYWLCTVEAMPLDVPVEFLAIDEIQLAAHAQRGHVFTDRLLNARGLRETWFLGSDTIADRLSEVVPTARIASHPRLSRLSYAGAAPLKRLPPRSALVAFSMREVYELAERIRVARGGAAVVLGALSPRARNAQVAMFQAGEVDFLVATDAIGMGLNLDLHHVAFAGLRKFDGHDVRDLEAAEVGQIAGRAGRYVRDGTFGAIEPLLFPLGVASAIETHRFPPVRKLRYRNSDLDFSSLDALRASLEVRPRSSALKLVHDAEDTRALDKLALRPLVAERARSAARIELLWEVCSIPDFEKLLYERHVTMLEELYVALTDDDRALSSDFVAAHVAPLDDDSGDVDTLIARIAAVRTWTYVSQKSGWVEEASLWRERTRDLEDRLSDALHERLVQRFVETKGKKARKAKVRSASVVRPETTEEQPSHPFAGLAKLRPLVATTPEPTVATVEAIVDAPHTSLSLSCQAMVSFEGMRIAQLVRGPSLALPNVRLRIEDEIGAGARAQVERRVFAFARDAANELLGAVRRATLASSAARGIVYALERSLGTVPVREISLDVTGEERAALESAGVRLGVAFVYLADLGDDALRIKLALLTAHLGAAHVPKESALHVPSLSPRPQLDERAYLALGFPVIGRRAIRVDVLEQALSRDHDDDELATLLRCKVTPALRADLARLR